VWTSDAIDAVVKFAAAQLGASSASELSAFLPSTSMSFFEFRKLLTQKNNETFMNMCKQLVSSLQQVYRERGLLPPKHTIVLPFFAATCVDGGAQLTNPTVAAAGRPTQALVVDQDRLLGSNNRGSKPGAETGDSLLQEAENFLHDPTVVYLKQLVEAYSSALQ